MFRRDLPNHTTTVALITHRFLRRRPPPTHPPPPAAARPQLCGSCSFEMLRHVSKYSKSLELLLPEQGSRSFSKLFVAGKQIERFFCTGISVRFNPFERKKEKEPQRHKLTSQLSRWLPEPGRALCHYPPEFNKRSDSQVAYTTGATPASSSWLCKCGR